jgi:hypothetical protein
MGTSDISVAAKTLLQKPLNMINKWLFDASQPASSDTSLAPSPSTGGNRRTAPHMIHPGNYYTSLIDSSVPDTLTPPLISTLSATSTPGMMMISPDANPVAAVPLSSSDFNQRRLISMSPPEHMDRLAPPALPPRQENASTSSFEATLTSKERELLNDYEMQLAMALSLSTNDDFPAANLEPKAHDDA